MHLQVLGSGSKGNAALVRAGETCVLVDAGLPFRTLEERLESARVPARNIDHVLLTHGHLDHTRSSGRLAKRADATIHCCERIMGNRAVAKARRFTTLAVGSSSRIAVRHGSAEEDELELTAVKIPHDADPTVAFRIRHGERSAVVLTDMGRPCRDAARALRGANLLVLEFNHDPEMLRRGPYQDSLKRRIAGPGGHLSNEEAAEMLRMLADERLHTLVLAHLSETNNLPELAVEHARATLGELGLGRVEVLVARQDEVGPNLEV